jgi:glycosyltransferase involved in cell wall biosynthesis
VHPTRVGQRTEHCRRRYRDVANVSLQTPPSQLVSVVIPTLRRSHLLSRALSSVFGQTHQPIEIIVVVDGPDDDTTRLLRSIADPRLSVIVNPRSMTAAGARNIGADRANGEWLAFLDDDDEWLPAKLERQMALAAGRNNVLVSCLSRIVTPTGVFVRPQRIYDNVWPVDEYLFDRPSPFAPVGFIQTSSYLISRSLFTSVLFRTDNPHDDWDFLLRLSKGLGARIETVPEVLAMLHVDEDRPSLSRSSGWMASLQWIDAMRPMLMRRAYAGFCLGVVAPRAANERAYKSFGVLLYRAIKHGAPRFWQVCAFIGLWILPEEWVRSLRRAPRLGRRKSRTVSA